jgi:hypothetical protein
LNRSKIILFLKSSYYYYCVSLLLLFITERKGFVNVFHPEKNLKEFNDKVWIITKKKI